MATAALDGDDATGDPHKTSTGTRKLWRSARERERAKARFELRRRRTTERVTDAGRRVDDPPEDVVAALRALHVAVQKNRRAAFGVAKLAALGDAVDARSAVDVARAEELCASRWGRTFAASVRAYLTVRNVSLLEHAVLLGRYRIASELSSAAGADPVRRDDASRFRETSTRAAKRLEEAPSALRVGLARAAAEIRVGWCAQRDGAECARCGGTARMLWSGRCRHVVCEDCFWEDVCVRLDERVHIGCPVCGSRRIPLAPEEEDDEEDGQDDALTPTQRRGRSLQRYLRLPPTAADLRDLPTPRSKRRDRDHVAFSLRAAHAFSVGRSRDVRAERLRAAAERGDARAVRACLRAGVDVDAVDTYGATALHVACAEGRLRVVETLLAHGADPETPARGGSRCANAARERGHKDVVRTLSKIAGSEPDETTRTRDRWGGVVASRSVLAVELDDAFVVDDAVSGAVVDGLVALRGDLPVVAPEPDAGRQQTRAYFRDAEGALTTLLENAWPRPDRGRLVVFSRARFLCYDRPGDALPPHVDLRRTDGDGRRSTHTMLLYLTDCEEGGETVLLSALNDGEAKLCVRPKRGRLFLFPHDCPHEGAAVTSVPKLLVRGEALFEPW